MNKLDLAVQLMEKSGEEISSLPPSSDMQIKEAEEYLKIVFPPSYKAFLKKFSCMSFEAEEFYGITNSGINANAVPSVIFATHAARARGDISESMIKIKTSGYGPNFCIDMSELNSEGEGAVYEVPLSYKRDGEKTKVADSFADFFYDEIKAAVEDLED